MAIIKLLCRYSILVSWLAQPFRLPPGELLGACMEAHGKQDLWIRQKPEVLDVLREQAFVQSVESSNRIEGVTVAPGRLRPLVIEGAKPRDRSEEAEIIEILPSGDRSIRFVPVSAKRTPAAIEQLCAKYRLACEDERVPPPLVVAAFVFAFLCIHPFRDGNGRVSRLTTAVVEDSREEYYRALKLCSQDWHEGKNEIVPWWDFFLGMLRTAYSPNRAGASGSIRSVRSGGTFAFGQFAAHQESADGNEEVSQGSTRGPRTRGPLGSESLTWAAFGRGS